MGPARVQRRFIIQTAASQGPSDSAPASPPPAQAEAAPAAPDALPSAEAIQETVATATGDTVAPEYIEQAATAAVAEAPAPSGFVPTAKAFVRDNPVAGFSIAGIVGFLGLTFAIAVVRTIAKGFSPTGKRSRTINKNKAVVEELSKYLPGDRAGLGGATITSLRVRTGFSPVEIFRKYLWYLLRERKFDQDAVADMVTLKGALGLSDVDVAAALTERAKRVYEKYGNVMLDTTGMSPAGVERKATARALFSKMLYLVECEDLLAADKAAGVDLRDIFGATEDDAARLRIASLYEVDLDAAMGLPSAEGSQGDAGEE